MPTPIIRHGKWEDNYDDPSHPIPSISALDVHLIKKGGGSDLLAIVAAPLLSDERSQRRLLEKIDMYLRYIRSNDYESQCDPPTCAGTTIVVRLHPATDNAIYELLERCKPWVTEKSATLRVSRLNEAVDAAL